MATQQAIAVVAESQDFYSAGVAAVLERQFGFTTVLTARNLDQLLVIFATASVSLAVVSDDLPGSDGVNTIRLLRSLYPDLRLAIFSQRSDDRDVLTMLAAGAHGVISRPNGDCTELMRALRTVSKGSIFVPAMAENDDNDSDERAEAGALKELTERQQQVIKLLSDGHPNKVIARVLGISPSTVKVHVHAAFRVLGVHSRLAAVAAVRPRPLDSVSHR
jgi:DNA-binding NarL/FixJ family response regulator